MAYVIENTVWPDWEITQEKRALLSLFFELADLKSSEAGPRMAAEVFTSDAVLAGGRGKISGTEGNNLHENQNGGSMPVLIYETAAIAQSRKNAWDHIDKRRHILSRVYTLDKKATDLILVGELKATTKSGKDFRQEFCARAVVAEDASAGNPRLSLYQVWAVSIINDYKEKEDK